MAKLEEVLADETSKIEAEDGNDNDTVESEPASEETPAEETSEEDGDNPVEDEPEEPLVEETPPVVQDLPADVKSYVDEKLPDVEVWGRDGEDGKVEKFIVKSAFDLPDDFIPRSHKDQQIQAQQFAKQDRLTEKFEGEYEQIQADNKAAETQAQLEASWSVELQQAQAEGRIPKMAKEAAGDEGFDMAAEVIEYMKQENQKLANVKAPYRIQSFTQALDLYEAHALKTSNEEKVSKEDAVQSKKGSLIGGGRSSKDNFSQVPKAGTRLEDVLAEYSA